MQNPFAQLARFLGDAATHILYPEECVFCGAERTLLCEACAATTPLSPQLLCLSCERTSSFGATHAACQTARTVDTYLSALTYEPGPVQDVIYAWKYSSISHLSLPLSYFVRRLITAHPYMRELLEDEQIPFVPVPMHVFKQRLRGFNQAEALVRSLVPTSRVSNDLLVRVRKGSPQASVSSRVRRLMNARGVYGLRTAYLDQHPRSRDVVLVDDVATTGATLNECACLLKRAGYKRVHAITLAHG